MECSNVHVARVDINRPVQSKIGDACNEFTGGFFGARRHHAVLCVNTFIDDEMENSRNERVRLARPGTGYHEER